MIQLLNKSCILCKKIGQHVSSLRFLIDGERIDPKDTVRALKLEDGDILDVMTQQYGGGLFDRLIMNGKQYFQAIGKPFSIHQW